MKVLGINKEAFNLHEENNNLANFDDGHFSERGAIIVLPKLMKVLASPKTLIKGLQKTRDYLHSNGTVIEIKANYIRICKQQRIYIWKCRFTF